jgi:hypothetical protein
MLGDSELESTHTHEYRTKQEDFGSIRNGTPNAPTRNAFVHGSG